MGLLLLRTNVANKTSVRDNATFGDFALSREDDGVGASFAFSNALGQTAKFIQKRAHPSRWILYGHFPSSKLDGATNLNSVGVQDVVHAVDFWVQYVIFNGRMTVL